MRKARQVFIQTLVGTQSNAACFLPIGVPEIASIRDHFALHSLAAYRARRHYVSRDTSENL